MISSLKLSRSTQTLSILHFKYSGQAKVLQLFSSSLSGQSEIPSETVCGWIQYVSLHLNSLPGHSWFTQYLKCSVNGQNFFHKCPFKNTYLTFRESYFFGIHRMRMLTIPTIWTMFNTVIFILRPDTGISTFPKKDQSFFSFYNVSLKRTTSLLFLISDI